MTKISRILVSSIVAASAALVAAGTPATQPSGGGEATGGGERTTTPSGLTIVTVAPSDGAARDGDTVFVHYAGRLENGKEFDSSFKRGEPIDFALGSGRVIKGWEEGITGMRVGEKRQLIIPPALAYGAKDRQNEAGEVVIPANSTLIFDVELVGIVRRAAPER